ARAFAATAVPVAAVVACFVFVLHNDAERVRIIKLKERAAAAIKTPHPLAASGHSMEPVVIRLAPSTAPKLPSLPIKESTGVATGRAAGFRGRGHGTATPTPEPLLVRRPLTAARHQRFSKRNDGSGTSKRDITSHGRDHAWVARDHARQRTGNIPVILGSGAG